MNQYMDLVQLECRSHKLDLNKPIRSEPHTFLHLAQKATHNVQTYFPYTMLRLTCSLDVQ